MTQALNETKVSSDRSKVAQRNHERAWYYFMHVLPDERKAATKTFV